MTDEATKQSTENENGDDTVPLQESRVKKEDNDDDDEEDLFESGDEDVVVVKKEEVGEEPNQEKSSSTSASEPPSIVSTPVVVNALPISSPPFQSIADIPIPLKSSTHASSTSSNTILQVLDPASFGLPPDVKIPKSVSGALLRQGKLLDILKTLPANLINDALVEYDDAVEVKGQNIRNHGAYLYGVVKRYQSVVTRAQHTGNVEILPMGNQITPAVHNRLELLVTSSFCTREEMDEKVRSKIRMLSERDALLALDELSSVERYSIRNFGSYFMGILNRYMRGEQQQASSSSLLSSSLNHHTKMSRPSPAAAPSARGRDQRSYRDGKSDPASSYSSRERSRDRFDDANYGKYDTRTTHHHQHPALPYDDRRGQDHHRLLPPPPPPPAYGGGRIMQPPPNVQQQGGMYPNQQQQHPPPSQMMPSQYNQPGMDSNNNNNMMMMPQNSYGINPVANPNRMNDAMPPYSAYMNQESQMPPPNMYAPPPAYAPPPPPPQQQQQHNVLMNQQPQQYGLPTQTPNYGGGWQQQQPSLPTSQGVDIFGLADKAASVVQALANQNSMQQQQGMPYPPNNSMPNYVIPPQAGGSYTPGMPPQQLAHPSQMGAIGMQHSQQTDHPSRSGRRTTATLSQLTPTVQYLVQSIQNSGAVEAPLDDGILGMIHDLPENMAVSALQRFVSIDKTTMRNKTAYLAGILRRELETIKKR